MPAPCIALLLLISMVMAACGRTQVETADKPLPTLPAGRIAAGELLASSPGTATGQSCIDCHGSDGNAPIGPTFPKLGGQYADYIAHALQAYRQGDRVQPMMAPQAATLSDQDIADLAVYFGSRTSHLRDLQSNQ